MSQIRNLIVSYGALNSRERIFIAEEYSMFFPGFRVGLRSHNKANEKQKGSSSADSTVLRDFLTCAHAQVGAGGLIASCGLPMCTAGSLALCMWELLCMHFAFRRQTRDSHTYTTGNEKFNQQTSGKRFQEEEKSSVI